MELTETEAYNRAATYCAGAEHCRAEIAEKLQRWGIDPTSIPALLQRLETEKYIDEERYCRAYVNDKYRFAKWGKRKIAQGLYAKRIDSAIVRRCLDQVDEAEYLDILSALLAAKRKSIRAQGEYELNQKLLRFAVGRGFEQDDIRRCMTVGEEYE
ncbi:MAG: RecX family transcriptional regulator [Mediterranea sp.]|jgi:regulatory protein|nr:RecX family transcriptional regulator [Mediterranea sp.]